MFLLNWYREWLEIRASVKQEDKPCESCETLKMQLATVNQQNEKLLARLMEKPEPIPERIIAPEPVTRPVVMPWRVRQQMLETEDKAKAAALRKAAQPDKKE